MFNSQFPNSGDVELIATANVQLKIESSVRSNRVCAGFTLDLRPGICLLD